MYRYVTKRLLLALLTLFVIMLVSYILLRLAPGDPAKSTVFGQAGGVEQSLSADKNDLAQNRSLREKLHLDRNPFVGFALWLKDVFFNGTLGSSASVDKGRPVTRLILERLPVTLSLNFWAIIIIYLFAVPLGIYSAVYPDSFFDRGITFLLFFLYSLPVFWVALILQVTLCRGGLLPVFPLTGISVQDVSDLSVWQVAGRTAMHYTLPVFCLCYAGLAGLSRYARSGMLEVINKDYIRTARAKGLSEGIIVFKHALRNAMIILVTLFAGLLPGLVAGSIFIEHIFSIPGMGSLSMLALNSRDIPLLMALFAFGGILTLAGILISDILYVLIDPRITFEGRK